jgi:hypothetical protein
MHTTIQKSAAVTHRQALKNFPNTSQISFHKNTNVNLRILQEVPKIMSLYTCTHLNMMPFTKRSSSQVNYKISLHMLSIDSFGKAMPWLRRLVTSLLPQRPRFVPGSVHVGFVVDKVVPRQVSLRVLQFYSVNITPP